MSDTPKLGHFTHPLRVEVLPDGRLMQLLEPFGFVDPAGKTWQVPQGAKVDGASIPRVLWTLVGGPFEGKYRDASVVHDFYCDTRTEPWQAVHRVFFDGMLAAGVGMTRAKLMYSAVYLQGPRWSQTAVDNANLNAPLEMRMQVEAMPSAFEAGLQSLVATASGGEFLMESMGNATPEAVKDVPLADLEALLDRTQPSLDEIDKVLSQNTGWQLVN